MTEAAGLGWGNCIEIQNCIATSGAGAGHGAGRTGHVGAGQACGARQVHAARRGCLGASSRLARQRGDAQGAQHDAGARGHGRCLGAACALRLGQVGALCTWLSSDSVFDPVLT